MNVINTIFGVPLGWLFYFCYKFINNYGFAILLFTFLTKLILFPVSLAAQINSVKMVKLQPLLEDIKERYSDNPKLYMQETKALYKLEKYNVFIGLLPLFIQIPLILGIINVMYHPLQHLLRINADVISLLTEKTILLTNDNSLGLSTQFKIIELIKSNPNLFLPVIDNTTILKIVNLDINFMGMNLSELPAINSPLILVVIFSTLSALLMCTYQNSYNVLQQEQGFLGKWGVTIFLVGFSCYFTFVVPVGIGIYWISSNIYSILILFVCNKMYDPKKYIDFENRNQKKPRMTKKEKAAKRKERIEAKTREKTDIARFYAAKKQLVFYSESSGFYKYFKGIIDYILDNSDITVHYVTSDLKDQVFAISNPMFKAYYVAGNGLIAFMMRMDADMVIMTMPDLQRYHIKRSLVRKDIEYVYLDHAMTSFHLGYHEGAFDYYDTIFCNGPNQVEEMRAIEKIYNLPYKRLINTGYSFLDMLLKSAEGNKKEVGGVKKILIAPSWQKDNILEYCLSETIGPLLSSRYRIILRPHPEFMKRFPGKMNSIISKYGNRKDEGLIIETDFSSSESIYTVDLVITDWSSIALEFSYTTKKPSVFINTPMKILNPNYKKIPLAPLDISLRDEIGVSVDVSKLKELPVLISNLLSNQSDWEIRIKRVLEKNIFNIGMSDQVAGNYIISTLQTKKAEVA